MREDKVVSDVLGREHVLAPSDVYNHEFRRALLGGYNAQEVDGFLARVADVLENLIKQIHDLKAQQVDQKEKMEEHRQMEETLRNALVTSQKFGENLIESAKREASLLVEAARLEKARIEADAQRLPREVAQELDRLQDQRDRLRAEIRSILAAHEALLDAQHLEPAPDSPGLFRAGNDD